MPDREKLIELYAEAEQLRNMRMGISECVDILIANGVTIQQWIPVTERLPDGECLAVATIKGRPSYGEMLIGYVGKDGLSASGYSAESNGEILGDVTHWMPLPEPPKEVDHG